MPCRYVWSFEGDAWNPALVILRLNRAAISVKWSPKGKKVQSSLYLLSQDDDCQNFKSFQNCFLCMFLFCHGQRISLQLEVVQKVSAYAIMRTKIIGKCLKAKKCVGVKCQIQIPLAGDGLSLSKWKN